MGELPSLWDRMDLLERVLGQGPLGLFTDVDGTLSEIVPAYDEASVSPRIVARLERLCGLLPAVVAVSGRPALQARNMVGVDGMIYYGAHGLERWEKGQVCTLLEQADEVRRLMTEVRRGLTTELAGLPGVGLEDKGHTLAVHFRQAQVPEETGEQVLAAAQRWAGPRGLAVRGGRMVVEVRPPGVTKGSAVQEVVQRFGLRGGIVVGDVTTFAAWAYMRAGIVVGDDETDADAFDMVHRLAAQGAFTGLAVLVASTETPRRVLEAADAAVNGVGEVQKLLEWLEQRLSAPGR